MSKTIHSVKNLERNYLELVDTYGDVYSYIPAVTGEIEADRLELFLEVRESLVSESNEVEAAFADFPPDGLDDDENALRVMRELFSSLRQMVPIVIDYMEAKHKALSAAGMGLSEYTYIYSIAFFSLLDHSPEDGPEITKEGHWDRGERILDGDDGTFSTDNVRRRYRRFMLSMLRNQLRAVPDQNPTEREERCRDMIADEIDRLRDRPGRSAWKGNMMLATKASFEPYRQRLERSYNSTLNCFEISVEHPEEWRNWSE
ncbi:MAG: hypothetical protein GY835_14530 [bacterium]|nr:hypothetical protein [bacterium]